MASRAVEMDAAASREGSLSACAMFMLAQSPMAFTRSRGHLSTIGMRRVGGDGRHANIIPLAARKLGQQARSGEMEMIFGRRKRKPSLARLITQARTSGWLSWWAQAILSVTSGITLAFANSVSNTLSVPVRVGRGLALVSLFFSGLSWLWTSRYGRLATKFANEAIDGASETSPGVAAERFLQLVKINIFLNIVGMGIGLSGAEAIIGTLAAKSFTQGQSAVLGIGTNPVQALDVLIVQANTNTVLAHFLSLASSLWLRGKAIENIKDLPPAQDTENSPKDAFAKVEPAPESIDRERFDAPERGESESEN